ncbi:hypothetical protein [Methylocapsa sp. S129]|uniref:hypothetical protein n=1 Tax=Methylocapsa sp. S129 TaxID=1641869 RepID=UPI00131CEFFC|nr:hypothetical protein [Methylocapsa sp. S129]
MATLAFVITGAPVLLHQVGQPLAIAFCLTTACFIVIYCERAVPIVVLVSLLFQTMFVAMASPYAEQFSDLDAAKAYNFITTVGFWLTMMARLVLGWDRVSPFVLRMILATSCILGLAGIFFLLGLPLDFRGSTIYMRNIGLPVLLFQICLLVASRHELAMRQTAVLLLALMVACGYVELLAIRTWLDFTNGWTYWGLASAAMRQGADFDRDARATGIVVGDTIDFLTTGLLNSSLLGDLHIRVVRLQGPNFHPISFGYALAIFSAFVAVHGRFLLPLAAIPLLLVVGAKGALALLLLALAYCLVSRFYQGILMPIGLAVVLVLYAAFIFYTGLQIGDFHVLGLIGGIRGFLGNPAGHTLGAGGNLSTNFAGIDWSKYQHEGATDIAVESAAGVLLYQMGVAGIAVIAIYLWLARTAWRLFRNLHAPALALTTVLIATMLVNGLFQEEAWFAPLALGLILAFAGLTFGAVDRRVVSLIQDAKRSPAPNSLAAMT